MMSMRTRLGYAAAALTTTLGLLAPAEANVDLEWRPATQTVLLGDIVEVGLYAVSDDPELAQSMAAMDVILGWQPEFLSLLGNVNNGPYPWSFSGFPNDSGLDGLNNTWADGNALYTALGQLGGNPAWAPPAGLLVTTLTFLALEQTPETVLSIPASAGQYTNTVVYDGQVPGLNVTGQLGSAAITIVPEPTALLFLLWAVFPFRRRR